MEKTLTLIVPSYNMERYLDQCVSSLLCHSIGSIEILIVNDGSKDSTLELARKWEQKCPESVSVIDKPNGNYGSCINAGLALAHGKYVKVLDADDSFNTENLDSYIALLRECEEDVVVSDYSIVDETGHETRRVCLGSLKSLPESGDFIEYKAITRHPDFEMHAVAYKRTLFSRFPYRQTEGISYTDQEWMFKPMAYASRVRRFSKTVYRYLVGREGQTVDPKVSRRMVSQTMTVCASMLDTFKEIAGTVSDEKKDYLRARLLKKIPSVYRIILLKTPGTDLYPSLADFDAKMREIDQKIAASIDREQIKFLPFRYVPYWRARWNKSGSARVPAMLKICQSVITRII